MTGRPTDLPRADLGSRRIAPGAAILILSVIASGFMAARLAAPVLWLATPIVAALILRAAVATAAPVAGMGSVQLPDELYRTAAAALGQLPPGDAYELLKAVVTQASAVLAARDEFFDPAADRVARENVGGLVDACCATALELARLDAAVSRQRNSDDHVSRRFAAARALFTNRLKDADAALRAVYAAGVEGGTPASDRVAELAAEIQADAAARRQAKDELQRLLGPTSEP
jgi:hypothetical protein